MSENEFQLINDYVTKNEFKILIERVEKLELSYNEPKTTEEVSTETQHEVQVEESNTPTPESVEETPKEPESVEKTPEEKVMEFLDTKTDNVEEFKKLLENVSDINNVNSKKSCVNLLEWAILWDMKSICSYLVTRQDLDVHQMNAFDIPPIMQLIKKFDKNDSWFKETLLTLLDHPKVNVRKVYKYSTVIGMAKEHGCDNEILDKIARVMETPNN